MALYDVYSNGYQQTSKYQQRDSGDNEYFTDIEFEVQVCDQMKHNQESTTNDKPKQIYRVVSEQTLKDEKVTAVSTVSYDGVLRDVGWFETATNENQYKLKLKTFRYYDYSKTGSNPSLHKVWRSSCRPRHYNYR
ncbi:uncharacterized protein LOC120353630 [Nilaparvata lugens]|uniref:uncharacterized protein LOC120353630 n=1 Tax=Nilaparvata lugens TaxID=108931 RepID=UPI00193D7AC0|nr:uncharacterized protein LOC120353630 [Nilaparvata lugens]